MEQGAMRLSANARLFAAAQKAKGGMWEVRLFVAAQGAKRGEVGNLKIENRG